MDGRCLGTARRWVVILLAVLAVHGAAAAPPPPLFLPGQPMIAGKQVLAIWAPVPGATAYHVYRNGVRVERVTANQYLGPLPEEPGEYRYQIAALDAAGAEGDRGEPGFIRVRRLVPPKNLVARPEPASNAIGIVWDKAVGAVIYNVYRAREAEERRLIGSVQEESYKDADVQVGVTYKYSVAAKDLSGMESAPSETLTAKLDVAERKVQKKTTFRALPTVEDLSVEAVGVVPLAQVSHLSLGPQDRIWVITPKTRQIHALDESGQPVATWGPYTFDTTGLAFIPQKLAFGRDGNAYVSDAINSVLACIDPAGNFLWARGILTPPPNLDEIWKDFPAHLKNLPPTPSSVLCLDQEVWVTDQRFQIVYRFDYKGNPLGYINGYEHKGTKVRFPGVGEMAEIGKDRILFTFPISHWAAVLDRQFRLVAEIGLNARGFIGGFVGIHGVQTWPDDRVLLTDPGSRSIQVFDAKTGAYLFHLSGPEPRRDPGYDQRADLAVGKPNFATRDRAGRVWVYDAALKRITVLRPSGPITPPIEGD